MKGNRLYMGLVNIMGTLVLIGKGVPKVIHHSEQRQKVVPEEVTNVEGVGKPVEQKDGDWLVTLIALVMILCLIDRGFQCPDGQSFIEMNLKLDLQIFDRFCMLVQVIG
jgi:hypothetical protein